MKYLFLLFLLFNFFERGESGCSTSCGTYQNCNCKNRQCSGATSPGVGTSQLSGVWKANIDDCVAHGRAKAAVCGGHPSYNYAPWSTSTCIVQFTGNYCYVYKYSSGSSTNCAANACYRVGDCIAYDTSDQKCGNGQRVYSTGSTSASCTNCGTGKYRSGNSHTYTSCATCGYGTYQNQNGQSGCKTCSLGTGWHIAGSAEGSDADSDCYAYSCKKGYHRSASGTASTIECTACSSLKYQPDDNHRGTTCDHDKGTCDPGEYYVRNGNAANRICNECEKGTYQSGSGHRTTSCTNCPVGKYQNEKAKSGCKNCAAGKYLTTEGNDASSDCTSCTTSDVHSQAHAVTSAAVSDASSDCYATSCKKGYRTDGTGSSTTCAACSAGDYQPTDGGTSCTACGEGNKENKQAQQSTTVAFNNYHDGDAAYECINCPNGYDNQDGHKCEACQSGKFATSGNTCTDCGEGNKENKQAQISNSGNTFRTSTGAIYCVTCKAGRYNTNGGECDQCSAGKYSFADAQGCRDCTKDHVQNTDSSYIHLWTSGVESDQTSDCYATSCKKGFEISGSGSSRTCARCVSGDYQGSDGGTACSTCGYSTANPNKQAQTSNSVGASFSEGATTSSLAIFCVNCPIGKDNNNNADDGSNEEGRMCDDCREGWYNGAVGTGCELCGRNKQAQTVSSIGINNYANNAATQCINCENGYDNKNGDQCEICTGGKFAKEGELNDCTHCPAGEQGQTTDTIGINNYANVGGLGQGAYKCITCENGYDNTNYGQCDICTGGMFSYQGSTCTHCPAGEQGQRSSTIGINEYTAEKAFQCVTCEDGYDNTDNGQCEICPINYYSVNGETCAECPAGFDAEYTVGAGTVTERARTCTACANGWYDDDSDSSTDCIQCPAGYNTDKIFGTGAVECVECPVGEWSPDSVTPCQAWSICPPGQYKHGHTKISNGECITCQDGTYCPGGTESIVIAESGSAATKWADLTVSSAECETFAGANWGNEVSLVGEIKGCYFIPSTGMYYYNTDYTSEALCTLAGRQCIQRKLSGTSSAVDVNHVGLRFFCSADYGGNGEGLTKHGDGGVDDGCTKCPDGFVGDSYYISETDVSRGDESMSLAECQAYGENLGSFSQISDTSFPWGCFMKDKDSAEYFYNVLQYNSNVLCNYDYGKSKCVKKIMEEGSTQCTECALGTWEIAGVCNPWIYADQTECPSGAAFVTGHSSLNSVCILDFVYENDEPSDMTLDLSIDSILCGEKYAQVDPQGNIVCTDCNRQEFLFVYRGPIVTTNPTYQRGSCCINSHHFVCEKMIDEYRKKCGSSHQKAVNVCV